MRVLVIEDEQKIANAIKKGLEQEAFAVDVAYDGNSGLDMAIGEPYDLLVIDIMLPDINGLEITKKIREYQLHTPILLLTAKGQVQDKVIGLDAGADDYLTKPFSFEELLARLRALLRRPPKVISSKLEVEDISVDTNTFEVRRGSKLVKLTTKEYALLIYLMRHPHRIVSKEQIINNVWDYDANILPNTVEVYIGYLRNKIDKAFPELTPLIQTIRGFGYKLGKG